MKFQPNRKKLIQEKNEKILSKNYKTIREKISIYNKIIIKNDKRLLNFELYNYLNLKSNYINDKLNSCKKVSF